MRIPANSFDRADLALCRAHGDAVHDHYPMPPFTTVEVAHFKAAFSYRAAVNAFEVGVHMPADLPLPPSYWDDLEHWLKTLAPAKPAAPQPCQAPAASAWRTGPSINESERVGLWHYRYSKYDKHPGNAFMAYEIDDDGLYRPAAPGAKLDDPYDESKYAAQGDAYVSAKQPDPAKPVQQAQATHSVCIKAHTHCMVKHEVGEVLSNAPSFFAYPKHWLPCDKDGWVVDNDMQRRPAGISCKIRAVGGIVQWRPTGAAA